MDDPELENDETAEEGGKEEKEEELEMGGGREWNVYGSCCWFVGGAKMEGEG